MAREKLEVMLLYYYLASKITDYNITTPFISQLYLIQQFVYFVSVLQAKRKQIFRVY